MDEIKLQAPLNISDDIINELYIKNNSNVVNTLAELWNLEALPIKKESKFDKFRDICDEHDKACYEYLNNMSNNNNTNG